MGVANSLRSSSRCFGLHSLVVVRGISKRQRESIRSVEGSRPDQDSADEWTLEP